MVSLAQMLDNNKFSMSGFCASYETDGRKDRTAVLGSVPAVWLCLCSPCSQGCSLPVLPQREVLQTEPVVSVKRTPPAHSRSDCWELKCSLGRQRESLHAAFLCVSMCVFSLSKTPLSWLRAWGSSCLCCTALPQKICHPMTLEGHSTDNSTCPQLCF